MTGVIKEMFFLVVARSEQMKEGFLRRFDRIHEIVAAIQHQHRLLDPRKEIHGVDFGRWAYKVQPAQRENADRMRGSTARMIAPKPEPQL